MLPKRTRLTRASDFYRVRSEGQSWAGRLLVFCKMANGMTRSRFGFSISRHVGNAVVRNRIKRRLSEIVRLQYDLIESGWDIVVIGRKSVAFASFSDTEEAVSNLLHRAGLYVTTESPGEREETM